MWRLDRVCLLTCGLAALVALSSSSIVAQTTAPKLAWDEPAGQAAGFAVTIDGVRTDYGTSPLAPDGSCGCSIALPFSGGNHTVVASAYNSAGETSAPPLVVGPVAVPGGPYTGQQGSPVSVDGSGSGNPAGTIVQWSWNWGDGSPNTTAAIATASHVYAAAGSYTVTLTVTDNAGATAAASTTATIAADTQAPTAPGNMTAATASESQINLSWAAATDNVGVAAYQVERCLTANCTFAQIGTTAGAATTYSDTGLTANTGYSYRVRATDTTGNKGPYSNVASATTAAAGTTVILWTANALSTETHGKWMRVLDSTAAAGAAMKNPNAGAALISPALASPTSYFEMTFDAVAGTPYHIWGRLRAAGNSTDNDSVHLQFSDSVDSSGAPTMRIGMTSSAELILQDGPSGAAPHGWGWTDNGYGVLGADVYFANDGRHTLRVQQREDGAFIDQIVLSPDTYRTTAPGATHDDTTIVPGGSMPPLTPSANTIVLWSSSIPGTNIYGAWQTLSDAKGSGGSALWNPNAGATAISTPLAAPTNYFETTFTALAGQPYHVWVRLRAENNSTGNDSVWVQFSDSVTSAGSATMQIGTTSAARVVLQNGPSAPGVSGYGWADNGWGSLGAHIYFKGTGTHTVRIQQREDGAIVDEIVLSPDTYLTTPPGPRWSDTTILPQNGG